MRLDYLNQEYCDDMSWMAKEPFVIFLSLENIYQISALCRDTRDVVYFILSFFLVIWWIRDFVILLIPGFIDLHKTKLWETMLVTNSVESDRSNLNADRTFSWSSSVDLLKETLFYDKLFHGLFSMLILLSCLLLPELCDLEWS